MISLQVLLQSCSLLLSASMSASTALKDEASNCTDLDFSDPVCLALENEKTFPKVNYTSMPGITIAVISGSISVICSLLLISIIFKSAIGLSTPSHRLVFAMSIADIIQSMAMAASTLPMPRDMVYEFEAKSLGNEFTCSLQGCLVIFGFSIGGLLNACLALYYMLLVTYKVNDSFMRRRTEPVMYIMCVLLTIPPAIVFWVNKWFNPTPFQSWCTATSYPWYCKPEDADSDECTIRGIPTSFQKRTRTYLFFYYWIIGISPPIIIIFSMIRITRTVYLQHKYLKRIKKVFAVKGIRSLTGLTRTTTRAFKRRFHLSKQRQVEVKTVLYQAIAYSIAGLLPSSANFIHLNQRNRLHSNGTMMALQMAHAAIRPSQGVFNLIVFVTQKASDLRRKKENLTWKQAIISVFKDREYVEIEMSNMSIVLNGGLENDVSDDNYLDQYSFDGEDDGRDLDDEDCDDDNLSDCASDDTRVRGGKTPDDHYPDNPRSRNEEGISYAQSKSSVTFFDFENISGGGVSVASLNSLISGRVSWSSDMEPEEPLDSSSKQQ